MLHRPRHRLGEARCQTITTLRVEVDADIQQQDRSMRARGV
jgi:hypothetical protein